MKLNTIISSVSIITLLFIMHQPNVVMPAPIPGICRNNCSGDYKQCESIPGITVEKKIRCVNDRKKCMKSCDGARYWTLIAVLREAVKSLN